MKTLQVLTMLFITLSWCGAMDVPTPPACVEDTVAAYGKHYDKVFQKRKAAFLESLDKHKQALQEKGDYAAAKELAEYAAAVESGEKLQASAVCSVELPDFVKRYQWVDSQGGQYKFHSGCLEDSRGQLRRVTDAGRDFVIVEDKECWFYEKDKQLGRFPLADGGKCSHLQAGAAIGAKAADRISELEEKFWSSMDKAMAKSRSKLKASLASQMKKLGSGGKLNEAAAVQEYLEHFDSDNGLKTWCKAPVGTFVAPASGWVVEFARNTSVHYGPGRSGLHHQELERVSPHREVYFYKGSTMLYIKGKLHKIANDTHRVLERQKRK